MDDKDREDKEKLLASLIRYHKAGLSEHKFTMSPSAVYLEERTIKALEELLLITGQSNSTAEPEP